MREVEMQTRSSATSTLRIHWWMAGIILLLVIMAGLFAVFTIPPTYQIFLDDQPITANRDLGSLQRALRTHLEQELGREVNLESGGQSWTYRLEQLGFDAETARLSERVPEAVSLVPWWQRFPWSHPTVRLSHETSWDLLRLEFALEPIRAAVKRDAVPAQFKLVDRQPTIIPEVAGQSVQTQAVLQALKSLGSSSTLQVPITQDSPAVTAESLGHMRIVRQIAEWSTHYDPTIPRADNVVRAAQAFNGVLLGPGEILSYNATVGPIDSASGWKEAFVIVSGKLVPGVGGGVCQVATTLYGAALRANLEIMERHPHQLAVTYIAPSQDAAIAQGWEDLVIRNTALGHLLIEAETGGGTVTFRLYGDVPAGQEVKIESKVTGSRPFQTETLPDPLLAPGRQVVKINGNPGMSSEAYRVIYQDGVVQKRELLSRDQYLPTTQVVLLGPAATPPQPDPPQQPVPPPSDDTKPVPTPPETPNPPGTNS